MRPAIRRKTPAQGGKLIVLVALGVLLACLDLQGHAQEDTDKAKAQQVVRVRPPTATLTRQKLPSFVGISAATAGAKGLSMNLVVIPPGGAAKPHSHKDFESAVYVLKGRVETRYGPGLKESVVVEAGDFLFIPPNVPHQPINLSSTEAAQAIVTRNDPNEQEHVILYDPAAAR